MHDRERTKAIVKVLLFDIETIPEMSYHWGRWNQNIGSVQNVKPSAMVSFAAKWLGAPAKSTEFYADWNTQGGHDGMIRKMHELLNEAQVVMHYNGQKFDEPWVAREMSLLGLTPPSPFKRIDLMRAVKKRFRFESNKLDDIAQAYGVGHKVHHEGFGLWLGVMAGDAKAQRKMEVYNKQDVVLLEKLYKRIQGWIPSHPHFGLIDGTDDESCSCGSTNLRREGYAVLETGKYQRYQCRECGAWMRSGKRVDSVNIRPVAV